VVLDARPATPVQLAHACAAAGFGAVIPASWGDELIARRVAEKARDTNAPLVQCSCPLVAQRFARTGEAMDRTLLRFVPPPIATARYLRSVYGATPVRITYAGNCQIPPDDAVDVHLSSGQLLEQLRNRGVSAEDQPTEFDSVIPPDRRRFDSEPGGVPSRDALQRLSPDSRFAELTGPDLAIELAQLLLDGERRVIDIAAGIGCRCSGAVEGVPADESRAQIRALEPPRSAAPVVDLEISVALESPVVAAAGALSESDSSASASQSSRVSGPAERVDDTALVTADVGSRRRSPPGIARAVLGTMPLSRSEGGRHLPRAYVARRRSSPRGIRQPELRPEASSASPRETHRPHWIWFAIMGLVVGVLLTLALASSR